MEYAVRVAVHVERRDDFGVADELTLDFASFETAKSPAEAALIVARGVPNRVAERLLVGGSLDTMLDRLGETLKEAE